jgi:hypothetical protein
MLGNVVVQATRFEAIAAIATPYQLVRVGRSTIAPK